MKPQDKLKQLMAKLVELPPTDNKLDLAIDFCSNGEFPTAQSVSDAIIADIQSASSPKAFLWDSCNIDLENDDVGSIVGFDASGGPVLDKYDIVPEGDVSELVVPPSTEVINGLTVTYPPYNSLNPSGQFIMKCMSKWWLKGAFDLVEQGYGLKFDSNSFVTTMPIQLDDIPPSGGAITMAYVMSSYNTSTFKTVSMYCAVNTNPAAYGDMNLTNPNGQANSYAGSNMFLDRVLCHELVHGVMSANISGFNAKLPKYFTEGTAELIAGADDTRKNELLATAGSVSMFQAGLDDNATDTLRWYTTGYIWLRWYIKHTSKKGIDLSFEHPLPDLEIFEYKVSDGVAFEYGRANNKRFDLIGDELVDFYIKEHIGLNKWDLCTSPEYLNSKYGSTIRIPFEGAKDGVELDYTDVFIDYYYHHNMYIFTWVGQMESSEIGPLVPPKYYKFLYSNVASSYNVTPYYNEQHGFPLRPASGNSRFNDISCYRNYCVFDSDTSGWDLSVYGTGSLIVWYRFFDFSADGVSLSDIYNGNVSNSAYIDAYTGSSNWNLLVQNATQTYGLVWEYFDMRSRILDRYPTVEKFRSKAITKVYSAGMPFYVYTSDFISIMSEVFDTCESLDPLPNKFPYISSLVGENSIKAAFSFVIDDLYTGFFGVNQWVDYVLCSYPDPGRFVTLVYYTPAGYSTFEDYIFDRFNSLVSNSYGSGYIVLLGFESMVLWGYSVNDILNIIKDINNITPIAYIFTPPPIFTASVYDAYVDLKSKLVANGINILVDSYIYSSVNDMKNFYKYLYKPYHANEDYLTDELKLFAESLDESYVYISNQMYSLYLYNDKSTFMCSDEHISKTKSPCYYTSFTQLPFSDRFDKIRTVEGGTQAYEGVEADILDVNLHTVYDPLSPSYYQGGGTCKEVYDFVIDPITNKSMLGLINYHKEDDNSPNVDNNYSYPIYGSGCPWIVYQEKERLNYDSIYFYLTRDNYSGTITYQLTSNKYSSLKPIFQTIVFGSPDTDNYTSKYPLYVGGGVNYIAHTEYSYTYTPPGPFAKPVTVYVEGNKYSLDLTSSKTSNISPIYPSSAEDSSVTNFAFRGSDGDWKYLASFDGDISTDDIVFAHKLADPYYWGVISPYVGSDIDYSYIYDINTDNTNIYKPVRIINPYRELKEERGFGAISLSNLYAKCSDNRFGIRKVKIKDYVYSSILDKIENDVIYLIDDFDKFDKLDIIFTDSNNQYTTTWHKNSLNKAFKYSLDIDFDLTRGIVYNLSWNVDKSSSTKNTFYNLSNNCTIVDVVGYKKKYSRYLVLPNSCVHKEFGVESATGEISTYSLNNVLCIYLGEG